MLGREVLGREVLGREVLGRVVLMLLMVLLLMLLLMLLLTLVWINRREIRHTFDLSVYSVRFKGQSEDKSYVHR